MKQINDIPVRRRPQSKDVHPGADGDAQRKRRQIWDLEEEVGPAAGAADMASDLPEPKPARPRSTPLILTNSSRDAAQDRVGSKPVDAPAAPDTPAAARGAAPEMQAASQKRAVSRPRVAEPQADAEPSPQPARDRAQPASMRQRSRPIMPPAEPAQAPTPPPQASKVNRAKTRILGFHAAEVAPDPLAAAEPTPSQGSAIGHFPAGWFVIVEGPGRGASFTISTGVSTIGRGEDQSISLDFGDQSVSRSGHASVAYDEETNKFFIGHGGKSNVVRRNGAPVLATEEMTHGDTIRIGKTTLRFVAFCGSDFTWNGEASGGSEGGHG